METFPVVSDGDYQTALMWAAAGGHTAPLELLFAKGACVKPKHDGWDPLMVAAAAGHRDAVDWLLARGVSFTRTNGNGKTAADLAADRGHPEIAGMLQRMREVKKWHEDKVKKGFNDAEARDRVRQREALCGSGRRALGRSIDEV